MSLILALDLGTSAVKCLLMDEDGTVLHVQGEPYPTRSASPGWSEQDPEDWVQAAIKAAGSCLQRAGDKDVAVISFSGHMSALILVDRSGRPLFPCITLSDSRSRNQTLALHSSTGEEVKKLTGNPILDAFLAPKLLWLKEERPELYDRAACLLFPKDYLRFRLTGICATDTTDAGNSLFYDPVKEAWDEGLAADMGFRPSLLPEILRPYQSAGTLTREMAALLGLREGIPVIAGAADMATSALGTGAAAPGDTVLTIGTSATMISVLPAISGHGFGQITFHPHVLPGAFYALGSHFAGGLSLNWLSELLHTTVSYEFLQELGTQSEAIEPGSGGVLFLPFLAGSGSPHFNPAMRGSFLGLSAASGRAAMFRAVLEGIAFNLKETLSLFGQMGSGQADSIRVGGGGSRIGVWPGILAHIFGKPVHLLGQADASAMGAAMLGGYAAGMFTDLREISARLTEPASILLPDPEAAEQYDKLYRRYLDFYSCLEPLYSQKAE